MILLLVCGHDGVVCHRLTPQSARCVGCRVGLGGDALPQVRADIEVVVSGSSSCVTASALMQGTRFVEACGASNCKWRSCMQASKHTTAPGAQHNMLAGVPWC